MCKQACVWMEDDVDTCPVTNDGNHIKTKQMQEDK